MQLVGTAEQDELRAAVRALLERHAPAAVRATVDDGRPHDPGLWHRLGTELGVLGLVVPEELGGAGAGHVERAVVAEELGRALLPSPFLASSVLAADTLLALGDVDLVPTIAAGERTGTVAVADGGRDGLLAPGTGVTARPRDGSWVVDGRVSPVLDGDTADVVLVYAHADDGPAFFATDGGTRTPLRSLDPTRRYARLDLDATPATRLHGDAGAALARVRDLAAVALAAEQVGVMRSAVARTTAYVTDRVQFGRPVGSYQAVKHQCADMYSATEQADSAARAAAWTADHDPEALPLAAAVARVFVGPAAFSVANAMVLLHGGLGYTWEHDAHLHYKRAKADELLLGPPGTARARLADLMEV